IEMPGMGGRAAGETVEGFVEVRCMECERGWSLPIAPSVYEQQALESCPCPFCGACVLSAQPEDEAALAK
ncbi:MAG: hypothetical protein ACRC33_14370, partial [Gemmataceae bacterium]